MTSPVLNIPERPQLIRYQEKVIQRGEYGQNIDRWVDRFDAWAMVETLRGTEPEVARKHMPINRVRIRLKSNSLAPLNQEGRFLFGDRILNIEAILPGSDLIYDQIVECREDPTRDTGSEEPGGWTWINGDQATWIDGTEAEWVTND